MERVKLGGLPEGAMSVYHGYIDYIRTHVFIKYVIGLVKRDKVGTNDTYS